MTFAIYEIFSDPSRAPGPSLKPLEGIIEATLRCAAARLERRFPRFRESRAAALVTSGVQNKYLVAHPMNRKWVITGVINGISRVNPLKSLGL
jgi:hypothetical protein